MSELTPEISADVVAACQTNADEMAAALGRALDGQFSLQTGDAESFAPDAAPDGFDGPGLLVLLTFGDQAAVLALPESSGAMPDWYASPDATGVSKLTTLAQELGMLAVPETLMAASYEAERVESIQDALNRGGANDASMLVPLTLGFDDREAQISMVWPLTDPMQILDQKPEPEEPNDEAAPAAITDQPSPSTQSPPPKNLESLPGYSRTLLKVRVPVSVKLAQRPESVQNIVELAPGSIIKFDKACDDLLQLFVADQPFAEGEAVKVGDKFGLRVNSMLLPLEHFVPARTKAS